VDGQVHPLRAEEGTPFDQRVGVYMLRANALDCSQLDSVDSIAR
jgi:hypothetical protein